MWTPCQYCDRSDFWKYMTVQQRWAKKSEASQTATYGKQKDSLESNGCCTLNLPSSAEWDLSKGWASSREICCRSCQRMEGKSCLPVAAGNNWSPISFPNWPKLSQSLGNWLCEWLSLEVWSELFIKQNQLKAEQQAGRIVEKSFFCSMRNRTRRKLKPEWALAESLIWAKITQSYVKDSIPPEWEH